MLYHVKKMRVNFIVKHRPLPGEHVLNGGLLLDNVKSCQLRFNNKIQIVEWDRTHFFKHANENAMDPFIN